MKRQKKVGVCLTKERDIPLLQFLWRWKVCTTKALCRKFYGSAKLETGYRRLLKLEKAGFIKCPVDPTGSIYLWTLDKKGFEAIRDSLPTLREEGFRSEHMIHDYWVTAVHLGEFLTKKPKNIYFFSEQVLRRVHEDAMPEGVPLGHRPDGYWFIEDDSKVHKIALEVELSSKRNADYESIDGFYRSENIPDVFWFVPEDRLSKRICNLFWRFGDKESSPHSFFKLQDFKNDGWNVVSFLGKQKGKSINQLLHNKATTSAEPVVSRDLINSFKSPHRSRGCK